MIDEEIRTCEAPGAELSSNVEVARSMMAPKVSIPVSVQKEQRAARLREKRLEKKRKVDELLKRLETL